MGPGVMPHAVHPESHASQLANENNRICSATSWGKMRKALGNSVNQHEGTANKL